MDYRNIPFKFGYAGLNLVSAPENLKPGQYTTFRNVRYRRDGTLEARPGTENFKAFFTQPTVDAVSIYPNEWDVTKVSKSHYIGKIFNDTAEIDGYIFFHDGGSYKIFINGVPVSKAEAISTLTTVFTPDAFSVVRTVAKTGISITIIDGTHYVINKNCNIVAPDAYRENFDYGNGTGRIPLFYAYKIGIATPTAAPAVAVGAATGPTGNYEYAYTYYSSVTGFESALSPSVAITGLTNDKVVISSVTACTDPQVNKIRYWRKGGTLTSSWRLVGSETYVPGATPAGLTDSALDATIAVAEAFDTDLVAPFSTVSTSGGAITQQEFNRCWGPFQGKYHFWCGDPVKKGYVYWNTPGDISKYDPLTSVNSVTDPGEELQNGFLFSSLPFVFSKLNLYALDFGGSEALPEFTPRLVRLGVGLAGKWAYAVGPNAVYFLGRDGIYATDCQPGNAISLTEDSIKPIFQGRAGSIPAIDWSYVDQFRMAVTSTELHFFYIGVATNSPWYHLVYDLNRGAWSEWTPDMYYNAYADESAAASRLIFGASPYGVTDNRIYCLDDSRPDSSAETFYVTARTGSLDNEIPLTFKEYGAIQLDANLASTAILMTPYYNSEGTTGAAITVTSDVGDVRRDYPFSLEDYYARSICLEFYWQESPSNHPILYQGNILFREDEERLIHWEMPPTDLGHGGWFHLKDGHFSIRSDSDVTLTVVVDNNTTDTYTLLTTGGVRLKRYVEFKPRRGKLYQFKLDSVPQADPSVLKKPFRFYGEESLVNGKPWITGATYQPVQPFGPAGYAQYRRTDGGT